MDEYSNDEQALAIAGAMLGEEPPAAEPEPETEAPETPTETAEETTAPVAEVDEKEDDIKVPLKALQEEKRKRQEYEARLKELEERVKPKEETIEDLYDKDPQGVTSRINAEIARLQNDDPFANAEAIERLRDLKIELKEKSTMRRVTSEQSFVANLQREVPDLHQKADAYTDFAITELGYDRHTLETLTNPAIVGPQAAINFVKTVAAQYNKAQAVKTVQQKAVQPKPTTSEPPGKGIPAQTQDIGRLKAEAKASGDWSKYLDAVGAL